jgi:acyl-CoA thioester hydrolase
MAEPISQLKQRTRRDYPYTLPYRTRWSDNDMYSHLNNSIYNFLYDSVVNAYLINHCGLSPSTSAQYGLVVSSSNNYFSSIAYPAVAELGLRVAKLGKSSVTYEIALFEEGVEGVKAVGSFTHVFVDRDTGRPAAKGMNEGLRTGLQSLANSLPGNGTKIPEKPEGKASKL